MLVVSSNLALSSTTAVTDLPFSAATLSAATIGLFSREPEVLRVGIAYLVRVAPFYGLVGLGMGLYFAAQGAGNVAWAFSAGVARLLVVVVLGGGAVVFAHAPLTTLFWIVAFAQAVLAAANVIGVWRARPERRSHRRAT